MPAGPRSIWCSPRSEKASLTTSTPASLWGRRDLVAAFIVADLKSSSQQTALGYLWWLLDPLLMTGIYTVLVGWILKRGDQHPPYPVFLMCGLLCWKCLAASLVQSTNAMVRSEWVISAFAFPRAVIPVASVLVSHLFFMVSLVPLGGVLLYYRFGGAAAPLQLGLSLGWLPVLLLVQLLLSLGGALLLSCIGVFCRDLGNLMRYAMLVGWYLSPGLYAFADVMPGYSGLLSADLSRPHNWLVLNPCAHLLEGYRDVLMYGQHPDSAGLGYAFSVGLVLVGLGLRAFAGQEQRFLKYI